MSQRERSPQAGFTLIEVLLVTVLLFFIALATFTSVRSMIRTKEDVDLRTEEMQIQRAVLGVIDRDLKNAFFVTADDLIWKPVVKAPVDGQPVPPPIKPQPITIFQGKAEEIFLSTRTHQRMSVDSPENEQHFVTYQKDGGKLIRAESLRAVSLKDRESPDKFSQVTLLEGINTLKFTYWDTRNEKWSDTWDTDRPEFQDILPLAVQVEIEYQPKGAEGSSKKPDPVKLLTSVRITETIFKVPGATQAQNPVNPTTGVVPNGGAVNQ